MMGLIDNAADLMDGGDDLLVVRDENGSVTEVRWHNDNEPVEYLRGMVEVITLTFGLSTDDKGVIYQAILDRLSASRIHDI